MADHDAGFVTRPAAILGIAFSVFEGMVMISCKPAFLGWRTEYMAARQLPDLSITRRTDEPSVIERKSSWTRTGTMSSEVTPSHYPTPPKTINDVKRELIANAGALRVGWVHKQALTYLEKSFVGDEDWLLSLFDRGPKIQLYKHKNLSHEVFLPRMEGQKQQLSVCDRFADVWDGDSFAEERLFRKGPASDVSLSSQISEVQNFDDITALPAGGLFRMSRNRWVHMYRDRKKVVDENIREQIAKDEGTTAPALDVLHAIADDNCHAG